jgi:hypothetical protein
MRDLHLTRTTLILHSREPLRRHPPTSRGDDSLSTSHPRQLPLYPRAAPLTSNPPRLVQATTIIGQPERCACRASRGSGFTATGLPTASNIGISVYESL